MTEGTGVPFIPEPPVGRMCYCFQLQVSYDSLSRSANRLMKGLLTQQSALPESLCPDLTQGTAWPSLAG